MKTAILTVGQIAEQLGQPPSRVAYVTTPDQLKPVGPAEETMQQRSCRHPSHASSCTFLAQAAECLLRLQLPLAPPEREALWIVFEDRLRRAYGGQLP